MVAPPISTSLAREPSPQVPPERSKEQGATGYFHRGIYLHAAIGPALFWGSSQAGVTEREFSGKSLSWTYAVGGTTNNGLVIGGMLRGERMFDLSGTDEDAQPISFEGVRFYMVSVGPFLELYPDPEQGLHFGFFVGLAYLNVHRRVQGLVVDADDDPTGLEIALSGGYEWWVERELSVGFEARLGYSGLDVEEVSGSPADVSILVPSILVGMTVN
jgi:hypothetical protein